MDDKNILNGSSDLGQINTDPIVPDPIDVNDKVPTAEPVHVTDEDIFEPKPVLTLESETQDGVSGSETQQGAQDGASPSEPKPSSQSASEAETGAAQASADSFGGQSASGSGEQSTSGGNTFGEEPHYQTPPQCEDYARATGPQGDRASYQGNGQNYNNYQAHAEKPASTALGILSLVFGIISIVFFCSCINILTGIAAIIFGIIQLATGQGRGKGMSIAGIVMGALSIIFFFMFWGAIMSNANLRDSIVDSYGDEDIQRFLEDYLDEFDVEINGQPVPKPGTDAPDADDATQL